MVEKNSINLKEVTQFSKISQKWWSTTGPFKALHHMNFLRLSYIKNNTIKHFKKKLNYINSNQPLRGLKFLDIGCGGGIITEPICRMGAQVTAIDPSINSIKIAKEHSNSQSLNIDYICCSAEQLVQKQNEEKLYLP